MAHPEPRSGHSLVFAATIAALLAVFAPVGAEKNGELVRAEQKATSPPPVEPKSGELVPLREEPHAAVWEVIDDKRSCERSGDNVKPHGSRPGVKSAVECMKACEGRWGCLAIDYYRRTLYCNFYREVCTNPEAGHDGASSYRIRLPAAWETISETAACAGVEAIGERVYRDVAGCKNMCQRTAGCMAVDYFSETSKCRIYSEGCEKPALVRDGSASYMMRRTINWIQTEADKGCETNADSVSSVNKRQDAEGGLAGCKKWCARRLDCRGLDYYMTTSWCILYNHACSQPMSTHDGVQSWRVLREGLDEPLEGSGAAPTGFLAEKKAKKSGAERSGLWSTIDANRACQGNDENVKHFKEIQGSDTFGIEACQASCENNGRCTAVDWYRTTNYCMLYENTCGKPHADHDGASSFRIARSDILGAASEGDDGSMARDSTDWRSHVLRTLRILDPQRSGFVSVVDLQKAMKTPNRVVTDDDMLGILSEVAISPDGRVNYEDALGLAQSVVWT